MRLFYKTKKSFFNFRCNTGKLNSAVWNELLNLNLSKLIGIHFEDSRIVKKLKLVSGGLEKINEDKFLYMNPKPDCLITKYYLPQNVSNKPQESIRDLEKILSRLGILSPFTVLVFPKKIKLTVSKPVVFVDDLPFEIVSDKDDNFSKYLFLLKKMKPLLYSKCLSLLPLSFGFLYDFPNLIKGIEKVVLGTDFHYKFYREFPKEIPNNYERIWQSSELCKLFEKTLATNIEIPFIQGLSITDIALLRRDEGHRFERFQYLLMKLIEKYRSEPDFKAMRVALREIHEGAEELFSEYQKIKVLRRLSYVSLSSFYVCLGALLMGTPLSNEKVGLIGSAASLGGLLKLYKDLKFTEIKLKNSKYYIPLLLELRRNRLK